MLVLGIRCWAEAYAYVILQGTQENPTVIAKGYHKAPATNIRAEQLHWLRLDILGLLDKHDFNAGLFKGIEPISPTKDQKRSEFEGVLQEAAYSHKKRLQIVKIVKTQISSKTSARKPRYLNELLEAPTLGEVKGSNYNEAALAALAALPRHADG